jgi:hypothetical protein
MQKDQAAGPNLTFCDGQPYNIIIFHAICKSHLGEATPLAMTMARDIEGGDFH